MDSMELFRRVLCCGCCGSSFADAKPSEDERVADAVALSDRKNCCSGKLTLAKIGFDSGGLGDLISAVTSGAGGTAPVSWTVSDKRARIGDKALYLGNACGNYATNADRVAHRDALALREREVLPRGDARLHAGLKRRGDALLGGVVAALTLSDVMTVSSLDDGESSMGTASPNT